MKNFYELTPEDKLPLLVNYMSWWIDNYQTEPFVDGPDEFGNTTVYKPCNAFSLMGFSQWYHIVHLGRSFYNYAWMIPAGIDIIIPEPTIKLKFSE